jgi:hypothetical protein
MAGVVIVGDLESLDAVTAATCRARLVSVARVDLSHGTHTNPGTDLVAADTTAASERPEGTGVIRRNRNRGRKRSKRPSSPFNGVSRPV